MINEITCFSLSYDIRKTMKQFSASHRVVLGQ